MGIKEKVLGKDEAKEKREALGMEVVRMDVGKPEQGPLPQELINQLGKEYYLLVDDLTLKQLDEDEQLKHLIPAVSHLNRTTKIRRRDAEIQMLEMECLFDIHTMQMEEDKFDHKGWAKLQALQIFGKDTIHDKIEGHRGKLISDQIRIIEARVVAEKKKRLLPSGGE